MEPYLASLSYKKNLVRPGRTAPAVYVMNIFNHTVARKSLNLIVWLGEIYNGSQNPRKKEMK